MITGALEGIPSALGALRAGGVVAVATDTVYGLAADPRSTGAVQALFALKGRPSGLALPVLVADLSAGADLVAPGRKAAALAALAERFWPGPLTVVVPARPDLGYALGGDGASIGLRCPDLEALRALLAKSGPLAVTSANRHGEAPCTTAAQVAEVFADEVGIILDGGVCDGPPSTVVSLLGAEPALLRAGSIGLDALVAGLG